MRSSMMQLLVLSLVLDETCARDKKGKNEQRPDKGKEAPQHLDNYEEKGRNNPKMVVFGDSNADSGRRFAAKASFDFKGIGRFPWKRLYEAPDNDSKFQAYLPSPGSATNGKVWPDWLRVPQELNFATGSATATDAFRSREICNGYTGEGEKYPTGTLEEQIEKYYQDILKHTDETLDYTHVIALGGNDVRHMTDALSRYARGGKSYVDPVAFDDVFQLADDGTWESTFTPLITKIITAWRDGVEKLIKDLGVTGKILLSTMPSFKGLPAAVVTGQADALDQIAIKVNDVAQTAFADFPQVQLFDIYTLSAALIDQPELIENEGFSTPKDETLITPCLQFQFFVDDDAEIMGTQDLRAAKCQRECALCLDGVSPCQNCVTGNPSAVVCDDPDSRVFWDFVHVSTAFHKILGEAVRQCSKDVPNYDHAWVQVLCPTDASP